MSRPYPVNTTVCSECGLPWGDHVRIFGVGKVTRKHCVALLKRANQGPPGPQGTAGIPQMSMPAVRYTAP